MATKPVVQTDTKSDSKTETISKTEANPTLVGFFTKQVGFARQSRDNFVQAVQFVADNREKLSRLAVLNSLVAAGYSEGSASVEASRVWKLSSAEGAEAFKALKEGEITVAEARSAKVKGTGAGGAPSKPKKDKFLASLSTSLLYGLENVLVPFTLPNGEKTESPLVRFKPGTHETSQGSFEIEQELTSELNDMFVTAWEQAKADYVTSLKNQKAHKEEAAAKKKGEFEAQKAQAAETAANNQKALEAQQAEEQKALTAVSA